tara:strand:- start:313 stop:669 length:357 start_codon:yes stop_codon:yes gene_type:complete
MNKKFKILCFDLDNVICKTKKNNYHQSKPIKKNINFINFLYDEGHTIKIFTARGMGRSNQNMKLAKKKFAVFTKNQLKKWNIKYHKLILGKPSYDIFVDDKNLGFTRDWVSILDKELK